MSLYSKKAMEHFRNPKNMGEMESPDGIGQVGNVMCGDLMHLYIKISQNEKGEEILQDIKYQTFGCVAAISTSSMITEIAKGKTLKEAMKIDQNDITDSLGGLPPIKQHCSVLAADALAEAIYDYLIKNNRKVPEFLQQKHEKLQKEKEILKEKYKEWKEKE